MDDDAEQQVETFLQFQREINPLIRERDRAGVERLRSAFEEAVEARKVHLASLLGSMFSWSLSRAGEPAEGLTVAQRVAEIDPGPPSSRNIASRLLELDRAAEAAEVLETLLADAAATPSDRNATLIDYAIVKIALGDPTAAASAFREAAAVLRNAGAAVWEWSSAFDSDLAAKYPESRDAALAYLEEVLGLARAESAEPLPNMIWNSMQMIRQRA